MTPLVEVIVNRTVDGSEAAIAHAAAMAASHHAETGRPDEALQLILKAETALFGAQKLTKLAIYLNLKGKYQEEEAMQIK